MRRWNRGVISKDSSRKWGTPYVTRAFAWQHAHVSSQTTEQKGDKREKVFSCGGVLFFFFFSSFFSCCFVMMDSADWVPWCACLWECCVVTSRVAHRFPAISTKPLIRHLAFSLVLDYSLCELPLLLSVIGEGGVCVWVCVCLPKFSCCVSTSVSVYLRPYETVCDSIKSAVLSVRCVHMYTALCACLYIHTCICQEKIDYITWGLNLDHDTEIPVGGGRSPLGWNEMKMSLWKSLETWWGLIPPVRSRMSSDLKETHQRIRSDLSKEGD